MTVTKVHAATRTKQYGTERLSAIEGLHERAEYFDIFLFSAHH